MGQNASAFFRLAQYHDCRVEYHHPEYHLYRDRILLTKAPNIAILRAFMRDHFGLTPLGKKRLEGRIRGGKAPRTKIKELARYPWLK